MYDQSLDPEYYHPAFAMHHNEPKFYDDFNHLNNFMKNSSTLPPTSTNHYHNALPTPPATPDKVPMSYGKFPHPISTQISSQSFLPPTLPSQRNPYSPNGDIQVVPDFFGKEDTTPEGLSYSTHEDAFASTTFAHLQNPHTNIEMPDLGTKRIYSSVNHSSNCQSMEYYMNNNHISANEAAYMRQFAYDDMFNEKRQRFDSTESLEPEFSRAQHNVLERQRRNDLKLRFNILRDNIPELANNEKAPKIQILKKALTYLTILKREEQMLLADKELEKQKKIILMERLKLLKIRN